MPPSVRQRQRTLTAILAACALLIAGAAALATVHAPPDAATDAGPAADATGPVRPDTTIPAGPTAVGAGTDEHARLVTTRPPRPEPAVTTAATGRAATAPEPAPGPEAVTVRVRGVWDRLARCESGGRWHYDGASGFDGGLQFHPDTWRAYAPGSYPSQAHKASRAQQIAVAERVLAAQGWGAWPACAAQLGLR